MARRRVAVPWIGAPITMPQLPRIFQSSSGDKAGHPPNPKRSMNRTRRRNLIALSAWIAAFLMIAAGSTAWLGMKGSAISRELDRAAELIPQLKKELANKEPALAAESVSRIRSHTRVAKDIAGDPLWTLAAAIPGFGKNFSAVAEVARSADDVAALGLTPLVRVFGSIDWNNLLPSSSGTNLDPLESAAPSISSSAHAVRVSAERLDRIDSSALMPEVAEPLINARAQLQEVTGALNAASDASRLLPEMLGSDAPRSYLLMVQNNAEARASGGIPGALAVLTLNKGQLSLGTQSSAGEIGIMNPILPIEAEQLDIYSGRLGKYMQDVNLTPDFPTAAASAKSMWERKTGQRVDGVLSIDPVALSYILKATGPVKITDPELIALSNAELPTELNADNVVETLLSDVYAKISVPKLQDSYFAGVAQLIFYNLSNGAGDATEVIDGIRRGTAEGRVLAWSGLIAEQAIIAKYPLGGAIAGPHISPAQFGVYFNDGTGAKMDYYVKRTVQLIKECPQDGYEATTIRVTSTNTAPVDAASSLPPYVTGDGNFGVPPGFVQTNLVAYGPSQAQVETAKLDGQKTAFAPYFHGNRPVGVLAIRLAPGESRTIDFTFSKIVQHTEPNVLVTPTVQNVKDVTLPTVNASCH
jgi:hypothetical protein